MAETLQRLRYVGQWGREELPWPEQANENADYGKSAPMDHIAAGLLGILHCFFNCM